MSDTKIDLSLFFDEKPEEKENNNEIKVKDSDKRENNDSHDRIDSIDKAINFINENIKEKPVESLETQNVNIPLKNTDDKPLTISNEETKVESKTIASEEIAKKSASFSDEELFKELKDIFKDSSENAEKCYNLINRDVRGFRATFIGEMTGSKGSVIKQINKLLHKLGKVNKEKYVHLAFNEIEDLEEWDTQTLYVVSNLTDAHINLFNKDSQNEKDGKVSRYERMLESLLNAPMNAYIILDAASDTSKIGFYNVDARIRFIFERICVFPDYSDERIATDLLKKIEILPSFTANPISQTTIETFLDSNRRYFPFKNNELTNYLTMYYNKEGKLPANKEDSFDLEETLSNFIGMNDAKEQIRKMYQYLRARKLFEENGIDIQDAELSLATCFVGPAGTGKTSLARVLAHLYFSMGFLAEDKIIETGGVDLMGADEAQSAIKATKAVNEAMNGVLFIDEIYGLTSDSAIAALTKALTDYRGKFALFIAGYEKETRIWLNLNSGLQSRMGTFIRIDPYNEDEIKQIYFMKLKKLGFKIEESPQMDKKLAPLLSYALRNRNSGNGRYAERIAQATLLAIANEYFKNPSRDISVVDAAVIPPISEVVKTAA